MTKKVRNENVVVETEHHILDTDTQSLKEYEKMCKAIFDSYHVDIYSVIDKIKETNTCDNYQVPVSVWIDKNGDYQLEIWDDTK